MDDGESKEDIAVPAVADLDNNPTASVLNDEQSSHNIPGSGVWEKFENRRWVVVMDTDHHRIPSRNRTRSEGSLDPSLSIQSFVSNFEVEEQQQSNYRLISDGNSLVRIDRVVDTVEGEVGDGEEDPQEGPSGSQQTRRVNTRARRRSSHLSSPDEQLQPPPAVEPGSGKGRRRRRRRRRNKVFLLRGNFVGGKKKWKREVLLSVESSPGRDSPSPDTLMRIVERGLVGHGEEMKLEIDDEVEESADQIFRHKVSSRLDMITEAEDKDDDTEDAVDG